MRRLIGLIVICILLISCGLSENTLTPSQESGLNIVDTELPATGTPFSTETVTPLASPVATPAMPEEEIVISFAINRYEFPHYQAIFEKFHQEHPNIKVEFTAIKDIMYSPAVISGELSFLEQLSQGVDTVANTTFYMEPEDYASGLFLDLQAFMQADPNFRADDFYPAALEYSAVDGHITLLPQYITLELMNFNPFVFSSLNIAPPTYDWTMSDLVTTAQYIGERQYAGNQLYGVDLGVEQILNELILHLIREQNINLLDMDAQEIDLTAPAFVNAVEQFVSLHTSYALYESIPSAQNNDTSQLGMWSDLSYSSFHESANPQVLPFPTDTTFIQSFAYVKGLLISSESPHPEAAWKWIEFVSRQAFGDNDLLNIRRQVPARDLVRQAMAYWETLDPRTADTYRRILEQGVLSKTEFDQVRYEALIAFREAAYKAKSSPELSVAELLQQAQKRFVERREYLQNPKN